MFFNLFSEVEPFAAILIAHGTLAIFGGTSIRDQGREREFLGPASGPAGSVVSFSSGVQGRAPAANSFWTY